MKSTIVKTQFQKRIRIIALLHQQVMIFVFRRKIHAQQLMNTQLTQQCRRRNQMYKRQFRKSQKRQTEIKKPKRKPDIPAQPLIQQVVSAPHSTEKREQVNFQQIRTKSCFHSKKSVWNLLCKTTNRKLRFYAVNILQRFCFQEQMSYSEWQSENEV
ncbi:Hypothetical_protein [Hexamita inflata]|uniref:Hypothetical_protein n=1 Tax=Hexamita inflata TaxID=28002 RepID=A0AA86QJ02_9EUKA|nr:Hypothetical protein HINF_LOCUS44802 [Hexamita inflata]